MDANHKTEYEPPKMNVIILRNRIELLCDSTEPNCLNLGYIDDPSDNSALV